MERDPPVLTAQGPRAREEHLARGHELVQHRGSVVHHALREHERFPRGRGHGHPGQLVDHREHPVQPAQLVPRDGVLPRGQEGGVYLRVHGFHVRAQGGQGTAAQGPQHLHVAPFRLRRRGVPARAERALAHAPLLGERAQRGLDHGGPQAQGLRGLRHAERTVGARVPGHEVPHGIRDRFQEREGHTHGQGLAKGVPHSRGVLHRAVDLAPAHAQDDRPVRGHQGVQQLAGGVRADGLVFGGHVLGRVDILGVVGFRGIGGLRRALRGGRRRCGAFRAQAHCGVVGRHGTEQAQEVRRALHAAQPTVRREALQLQDRGLDDLKIQQLAQLGATEQLVEQ